MCVGFKNEKHPEFTVEEVEELTLNISLACDCSLMVRLGTLTRFSLKVKHVVNKRF